MWDRILVPVDGSESADAALEHALDVAADGGATVHLLSVANTNEPSLTRIGTEVVDALEHEAEEIVERARERAERRDVTAIDHVVQGDPREVIVEYANAPETELVVMGTRGRHGLSEYFLGSVTEHVVNASTTPVLTVRVDDDTTRSYPYEDVLVPTDGSDHARAALRLGSAVATRCDGTLHLLFVLDELAETIDPETAELTEERERQAREILDEEAKFVSQIGVDDVVPAIELGVVPRAIEAYADTNDIDLVVMGTHGRTGVDRFLLGSFTERVLRTSPVPVLTTTAPTE